MLNNLKKISLSYVLVLAFVFQGYAYAAQHLKYPIHNPVPGGIAVIDIKATNNNSKKPSVKYNNKKIMVRRTSNGWQAIVGLSLNTKKGRHQLKIITANGTQHFQDFITQEKSYKKQYITIKNKGMVSLSPENLKRALTDKKVSQKAFKTWLEINDVKLDFLMPVEGRISGRFGLKRYFNNKPRKPHSGIDIAAPTGTTIISPADGVVIATGNFYFNGNVVFIDHGQGLITMFCHMDKINVSKNQKIKKSDKIGEVGETGRVTGAHLHFSVSLNNTRIDPELVLPPIPGIENK